MRPSLPSLDLIAAAVKVGYRRDVDTVIRKTSDSHRNTCRSDSPTPEAEAGRARRGMAYDSSWVEARLRRRGWLWRAASWVVTLLVGLAMKIFMKCFNTMTVFEGERLSRAVWRPAGVPLLTVANHESAFDDPGLWGVLGCGALLAGGRRVRWTLALRNECFASALRARFFALGKVLPVNPGEGVHQPAMDFCLERLQRGDWVHIFPEGKVNVDKGPLRLRRGAARLAAATGAALVLPLWHEHMDAVMPNTRPYRLRCGQRAYLGVGEPVDLDPLLHGLKQSNASEDEVLDAVTARLHRELLRLRDQTRAAIAARAGAQAGPPAAEDLQGVLIV